MSDVKRIIDGTYHGCEGCFAWRYLAEPAYRVNRRFELSELAPGLVCVSVRTPPRPAASRGLNCLAVRMAFEP